jgi:ABC-type Co2+ transport system permease subunit
MKDNVVIGLAVISIVALYTAVVEWRNDNKRDSKFLFGVSSAIFAISMVIQFFF